MPILLAETTTVAVPSFSISADLVAPITSAVQNSFTTVLPIGIGIMCLFIGAKIIKKLVQMYM